MMIEAKDVHRYHDLDVLLAKAARHLKDLKDERDELEARLIRLTKDRKRVESASLYKLVVTSHPKTYNPPYKSLAIEVAGEDAVKAWVTKTHPHDTTEELQLVAKKTTRNGPMPRKFADAIEALASLVRRVSFGDAGSGRMRPESTRAHLHE